MDAKVQGYIKGLRQAVAAGGEGELSAVDAGGCAECDVCTGKDIEMGIDERNGLSVGGHRVGGSVGAAGFSIVVVERAIRGMRSGLGRVHFVATRLFFGLCWRRIATANAGQFQNAVVRGDCSLQNGKRQKAH